MDRKNSSFRSASERWTAWKGQSVKLSSLSSYVYYLERYILPEIGDMPLKDLDSECLEAFIISLQNSGMYSSSINKVITIVKGTIDHAEEQGCTVAKKREMRRRRVRQRSVEVLSNRDREALGQYIKRQWDFGYPGVYIGIVLSLCAGLRVGEVCALKWENIDLQKGIMLVEGTMCRVYSQGDSRKKTLIQISTPKTENSRRVIPLPQVIVALLSKTQCAPECFVLTGSPKYMEPRVYTRKFKGICDAAGISACNYHKLRHTFATRCVEVGFDLKALSEILGHAKVSTTLELYTHPTIEMKQRYMELLMNS